jgi:hypothetical protein
MLSVVNLSAIMMRRYPRQTRQAITTFLFENMLKISIFWYTGVNIRRMFFFEIDTQDK